MPAVRILESGLASFSYAGYDLTPAATPTDLLTLTAPTGRVLRVRSVTISGIATTAGVMPFSLIKRTEANTAGTSTAPTPAKLDKDDAAAAVGVLALYTANASSLGAGTTLKTRRVFMNLATAQPDRWVVNFGQDGMKPLKLAPGEMLAINGNGAALPAGSKFDLGIEWTE